MPSPIPRNFTRTYTGDSDHACAPAPAISLGVTIDELARHADSSSHARALPDHGEGQSCQVAQEGGRHRQVRRRHRRNRDRQGDHGGGSGRRGHAGQDSGAGRHQRCRGQYADRHDPRRGRGPSRAQGRRAGAGRRRGNPAGAAAKGRGIRAARGEGRAGKEGRSAGAGENRDRRAAAGSGAARARGAGRHRDGHHDHARGVARRHGRGNAPRCRRVRDRRGSRRISRRLQGDAGPARRNSARGASSIRRSPSMALPVSASAPRSPG